MKRYVQKKKILDLALLNKDAWKLGSFDMEITARCNLACRHCYIREPVASPIQDDELTAEEIVSHIDDAAGFGALTCLITGGEPLLREDFSEIYTSVKKKGLLPTIFTNGTLLNSEHIKLFKKYPPRYVELTVYGASEETFDKITRTPGSYKAFRRGLSLLQKNSIPFRLKSVAMRSNLHEQKEIRAFCLGQTQERFRFDPFLHLRFDGDPARNKIIEEERLAPEEIVRLETDDPQRHSCLEDNKEKLILSNRDTSAVEKLFFCGAGQGKLILGYDGMLRLCESLIAPDCVYDLRNGSLEEAINTFVPRVRAMTSARPDYMENCAVCSIINLCLWCPASAQIETGEMDRPVEYFCRIAHARKRMLHSRADHRSRQSS